MVRRVLITGSTTGLGLAAAAALLDAGHEVVLHARSSARAADLGSVRSRVSGVVVGDLASSSQVRTLAERADDLGPYDAVIHNAGVYVDRTRTLSEDGHVRVFAVNVLAPYLLSALMRRPGRLVFLSSGMHRDGNATLDDLDWTSRRWSGVQAYCDSKLYVTTLSAALASRWPESCVNAVDPGWVPTRMGGPGAPDDLILGHTTQVWLSVSDEAATTSGGYWYHQRQQTPAEAVTDTEFQQSLLSRLADLTGVELG